MSQIRVASVCHSTLLYEGLARILSSDPSLCVVGEGKNVALREPTRADSPQVVLLDGRSEDGLELCARLTGTRGGPHVLFLAAEDDDQWTAKALAAGASGVLARGAGAELLIKAVHVVLEGQIWAPREVIAAAHNRHGASQAASADRARLERGLSTREQEILRQAAGGLSNRQIADRLAISQATVKAHLTRIFQKLGLRSRSALAALFHGVTSSESPLPLPGSLEDRRT